ncbi:MAG: T9SS type A sorting domain-containing protein [Sphingobacteriales bacterium]|nr:T9SS type A sorting domain-containing protein [Sphingobacteriales bacterium]OJY92607.1 MAG: hypothetical protein BGP14_15685 [Sphingobacteriales bacterium 44-15]
MKKHLLLWFIVTPFVSTAQQTYTWNTSSGSWTTASNWSPQRNTPAPDDILAFNAPATVTGLPASETIGRIYIYNNAAVSFSAAAGSSISIGNTAIAAPHFAIASGSSLAVAGSNSITLNIVSGCSAQIDGSLSFAGSAHRLSATAASAITFSSGAVFTAGAGFSGNAFGNVAANKNSVIFQSGATYILKAGGNPFGLAAPDAVVIFNSGSIYRHQVNGVGPSVGGRTYGNLYIEANVNFSGIGSARDCIIQNDLNILSGFFSYKPNTLGSQTGNFNIYGDILAAGASYIDIGSANMPGAVRLPGTNQTIGSGGGTGSISFDNITVNNTSTTLSRPVAVSGTLSLQNGKIITSSTSLLTLASTAVIQSCTHNYSNLPYADMGCDISYIEGPVRKTGLSAGDFIFPVGINGKLRPAAVRNATGDFTAEFVRGDPYLDLGSAMGAGIHHISHLEYWNISGSGNASVEVSFFDPNSGGVTDMNALRVARFDGSQWTDQGVSSLVGSPGANGAITSNPVAVFGNFTLAGALGYPNNPLPLLPVTLNVIAENDKININWTVFNDKAYKYYTVEKEAAGAFISLTSANSIQGDDNQHYKTFDPYPTEGENRYRLKLTGENGEILYSGIASIVFRWQRLIAYPNPAREKIFIKIPKSSSISEIAIVHISGSVIKWLKTSYNQTTVNVDIQHLASGVYYIRIIQAGYSTVIPIVKY